MTVSQTIQISIVFRRSHFEVYTGVTRTNAHNSSECLLWALPTELWAPQHSPVLQVQAACSVGMWQRGHGVKKGDFFQAPSLQILIQNIWDWARNL